ncbi:hypothetical protein AO265_17300 [Pseudomonas sp. ABAC61]|nr:hypothetical protein AO265_17300 [Pseudomonas sp. ABAC61]
MVGGPGKTPMLADYARVDQRGSVADALLMSLGVGTISGAQGSYYKSAALHAAPGRSDRHA